MICSTVPAIADDLSKACKECGHIVLVHVPNGCEMCKMWDEITKGMDRHFALDHIAVGSVGFNTNEPDRVPRAHPSGLVTVDEKEYRSLQAQNAELLLEVEKLKTDLGLMTVSRNAVLEQYSRLRVLVTEALNTSAVVVSAHMGEELDPGDPPRQ